MFARHSRRSTGIDIAPHKVRFVTLYHNTKAGTTRLLHHAEFRLPPGTIANSGLPANAEPLADVLEHIHRRYHVKSAYVGLPSPLFAVECLYIPISKGVDVKTTIENTLHQTIVGNDPRRADDHIVIEYEITSTHEAGVYVRVSATTKPVIEAYWHTVNSANIKPITIESQVAGAVRACSTADDVSQLLVGLNHDHASFMVANNQLPLKHQMANVGVGHIDSIIRHSLNTTYEDAAKIRHQHGLMHTHREPKVYQSILDVLSPISHTMQDLMIDWRRPDWGPSHHKQPIQKAVLYGEHANLPGWRQHVQFRTKLPVEIAEVWQNVPGMETVPSMTKVETLRYTPAIGLAMQGI